MTRDMKHATKMFHVLCFVLRDSNLILPLFHVLRPFLGDSHENFEWSLNNKIQDEHENVDPGKLLGKPFAGLHNRHVEKVREEAQDIIFAFNDQKIFGALPDPDAEKTDEGQEEQEDSDTHPVKTDLVQRPDNSPERQKKGDRVYETEGRVHEPTTPDRRAQFMDILFFFLKYHSLNALPHPVGISFGGQT